MFIESGRRGGEMTVFAEIKKTLKRAMKVLFIIMVIFYITFAFISGVFDQKSVKSLTAEETKLIIDAYGLVLPNGAVVKQVDSYLCMGDRYYVLEIDNVNDIVDFKRLNSHIYTYIKFKLDIQNILFPNYKYVPNYKNSNKINCFYKEDVLYLSIYPFCEEYGRNVMDVFNSLIK